MRRYICLFVVISVSWMSNGLALTEKKPNLYEYQAKIVILNNKHYFETLVYEIKRAKVSIYISMYLFKTTKNPKNPVVIVVNELIKARKRGVAVKILLEKSGFNHTLNSENQKVAIKLRQNKISVCFDTLKTQTHTKVIVIDDYLSFVGSHNLSASALHWNNEISVLVRSKPIAKKMLKNLRKVKGNRCFNK
ncbi:MAG: phospholipase [Deltaproteobacteria bacterium]|jgi:phosphatidylserine/phosphatidylglycerophosphate/cardiolipin synthase-like enzyme|nr:phospholipase [Deltaproteobacteria bacterium]MBT4527698.1 phospholipase [Deltaproteobacteria bacterium]